MSCAVRKEAEVRGPGSGRFSAQPPAGEGSAARICLRGGEASQAGNRSSVPLADLAPVSTTAVTTVVYAPRCPPERVSPLLRADTGMG